MIQEGWSAASIYSHAFGWAGRSIMFDDANWQHERDMIEKCGMAEKRCPNVVKRLRDKLRAARHVLPWLLGVMRQHLMEKETVFG